MPLRQGKKALAETSPNFSNQGIENAIADIIQDGWIQATYNLDLEIENNTVMTTSQKTDLLATINHDINFGRLLGDLRRHTANILNASLIPLTTGESAPDFTEIVSLVASLQVTIPEAYGVSAVDKGRSVDDHFGTLRGILLETSDSSRPPMINIRDAAKYISAQNLAAETTYITAVNNLKNFILDMKADSTDFQQSLDSLASAMSSANTTWYNALGSEPYLTYRTQILADRQDILQQVKKENDNIVGLRPFCTSVANTIQLQSMASDENIAKVLSKVAQHPSWQDYYENYKDRATNVNPILDLSTSTNIDELVTQRLAESNLPDVKDYLDIEAVVEKGKKHPNVDTKGFDKYTDLELIPLICEQLNVDTEGKDVYGQAKSLLSKLDADDVQRIKDQITFNISSTTFS